MSSSAAADKIKIAKAIKKPASSKSKSKNAEGEGEKKHRRVDRATLAVKRYQNPDKCPNNWWKRAPFRRNVRAIMQKIYGNDHRYQFSSEALDLIQKHAEDSAFKYLKAGQLVATSCKRVILKPDHLATGRQIQSIAV